MEESVKCISFNRKKVLGAGKFCTVFEGNLKKSSYWIWTEKQPVAVKQILKMSGVIVDMDIIKWAINCKVNNHPNIVQYYAIEENPDFWYLALEPFNDSLKSYAQRSWKTIQEEVGDNASKPNNVETFQILLDLCHQAAKGLSYVHEMSFVHKDINPNNFLVRSIHAYDGGKIVCKLADLGISKRLMDDPNTLSSKLDFNALEWIAPELLCKPFICSTDSDVWAFGCVIYNILSAGKHPFAGVMYRRAVNVLSGEFDLNLLRLPEFQQEDKKTRLLNLIEIMIDRDPSKRPNMSHVLEVLHDFSGNK